MKNRLTKHYIVVGKVQGVFFRASTKERADTLGITGWVRNLPDGRVEIMACGESENIAKLEAWLKKGPPLAKVEQVIVEEMACQKHNQFEVR